MALRSYFVKTPKSLMRLFPKRLWRMPKEEKVIYLTFDDGPTPEITPWVLDLLKQYQAKATFFCIGKNVVNHPEIKARILSEGHQIGNHTHNHLNGFKSKKCAYLENIAKATPWTSSVYFRPPYGRCSTSQAKTILSKGFTIVMWHVLSGDFDKKSSAEQITQRCIKKAANGSIIVFHDSVKAFPNLKPALPKILDHFKAQGYRFEALP